MQNEKKTSYVWLLLIQFALAFEWLHSGWGKWTGSAFMDNLGKTLEGFAAKTQYDSYGSFLTNTVIPNTEVFGNIIRSGEVLVGLAFVIGGIVLLYRKSLPTPVTWILVAAFFGGALMNLNFFLASGATSPSAWGLNLLMSLLQIILGLHYIFNRKDLAVA